MEMWSQKKIIKTEVAGMKKNDDFVHVIIPRNH